MIQSVKLPVCGTIISVHVINLQKLTEVIKISSDPLECPDWTAEDWSCEILNAVKYAAIMTLSIQSKWEDTGSLNSLLSVNLATEGASSADPGSHLSYVSITLGTGRVWGSCRGEGHVVLSSNPGQVAGESGVH